MSTGELRALITSLTKGKDLVPCEDTWLGDNEDVETAVHNAVTSVPSRGGVVIVCGTTFIMASARAAIGIMEPRDSDILSETINSSPQAKSNFDAQENFNKLQ